ncbi:MAG: MerR family transcriptional regulator [Blastocatellia bacterium]
MQQEPVPTEIPDKLFFKIGEVCELVGVQAHVLRYWETEFPSLQPQKNRAGQRTYRRRDVEMALRIRQLLYDEGFTIAGAKRKIASEGRTSPPRLKVVPPAPVPREEAVPATPVSSFAATDVSAPLTTPPPPVGPSRLSRETIQRLRGMAEELLTLLEHDVRT